MIFHKRLTQSHDEDTIEYYNPTSESTEYKYFQGMTFDDPTTTVKYKTTSTNNYDDEITFDDYITTLYSETTSDDFLTTSNDRIDMYPVKYQTEGILYIFCFQR